MKTMMLLSKGYEETEAITVIDYLRRAEIPVDVVATEGKLETEGAHHIHITADHLLEEIDPKAYDLVITPGGMGGVKALMANEQVITLLQNQKEAGKEIASICASPLVLNKAGISEQIKGTVYPGLEEQMSFKEHVNDEPVVYDEKEKVMTSQGPATAVYFALAIIENLKGKEVAQAIANDLLLPQVEAWVLEK
ncbi:MAG: DJ-1/PfpI family protein [Aerococcus sp.]|nr:DJ-1/PfpI family protein [Aerococcus sp.]